MSNELDGLAWDIDFEGWLYERVRLSTVDGTPYEGRLTGVRWREISCVNRRGEIHKLRLPLSFELDGETGDPISFDALAELRRL